MKKTILFSFLLLSLNVQANYKAMVNLVDNQGLSKAIGEITFEQSAYGILVIPNLTSLPPGLHGLHIHQNPSCAPGEKEGKSVPALAAGGHYDPGKTGKHLGPYDDNGHLGDLPVLTVTSSGTASLPTLAPRLSVEHLKGRSLMIHQQGDNYSDNPEPLGGGGARLACGVIEEVN